MGVLSSSMQLVEKSFKRAARPVPRRVTQRRGIRRQRLFFPETGKSAGRAGGRPVFHDSTPTTLAKRCMATPAISDGVLFFRTPRSHLGAAK